MFAKLGEIILNDGIYKNEIILSKEYLNLMHTDLIEAKGETDDECLNGYGYGVWKGCFEDSYRADGLYGQFLLIYPKRKACVTITARNQWNTYDIIEMVNEKVIKKYYNLYLLIK